jgi:hypothetical protein
VFVYPEGTIITTLNVLEVSTPTRSKLDGEVDCIVPAFVVGIVITP